MSTITYQESKNMLIRKLIKQEVRYSITKYLISFAYRLTPNYASLKNKEYKERVTSYSGSSVSNMETSKKAFKNKAIREGKLICASCGRRTHEKKKNLMTVDHIKPLAMGGSTKWGNLQLLCIECHKEKTKIDNRKYNSLYAKK